MQQRPKQLSGDVSSMRTLVMGDVHGAHKAMVQVLKRANFDYENDRLIFLGDVVDGWPEVKECVDELLKINNLIALMGNHDKWAYSWMCTGFPRPEWVMQGGQATLVAYGGVPTLVSKEHLLYFSSAMAYFIDNKNRCFVHGGFHSGHPKTNTVDELVWDREMWEEAYHYELAGDGSRIGDFDEIYIGHTQTWGTGGKLPVQRANVWNMDQGAGWNGVLSAMDVDTKEVWQSDLVQDLYPETANARMRRR